MTTVADRLRHELNMLYGKHDATYHCMASERDSGSFRIILQPVDAIRRDLTTFTAEPETIPVRDKKKLIHSEDLLYSVRDLIDVTVYRQGFLDGLQEVITLISDREETRRPESRMFHRGNFTRGMANGYEFALVKQMEGDTQAIVAEIKDNEDWVARGIAQNRGSMRPSAAPRIYKDGYIQGLKDALEIINESDRDR